MRFLLLFVLLLTNLGWVQAATDETPAETAQKMTAQAVTLFNRGQSEQARVLLEQALQINETGYEAHFWLGRLAAQRAASAPAERATALRHFRRALELQPFGEQGDLTRAWMFKVGGRPDRVAIIALERAWESGVGAMVRPASEETSQVREVAASLIQTGGYQTEPRPELRRALRQANSRSQVLGALREAGRDPEAPRLGWIVLLSVGEISVEHKTETRKKSRKSKEYETYDVYTGAGSGSICLYDVSGESLGATQTFSESARVTSDSGTGARRAAYDKTVSNLGAEVWKALRRVAAVHPDPRVFDETLFAAPIPGVYVRAAAPFERATRLPRFFFAGCRALQSEHAEFARYLGEDLQAAILEGGQNAIVAPGSARSALRKVGWQAEGAAPVPLLAQAASENGCRYAIDAQVVNFVTKVSDIILFSKTTVSLQLRVRAIDAASGAVALDKIYDKKFKKSKLLGGDMTDKSLEFRAQIMREVGNAAVADLKKLAASSAPLVREVPADDFEPVAPETPVDPPLPEQPPAPPAYLPPL